MFYGIDIFSGAGGLSLGAEMAGINMLYAIEMNPSAVLTYKRNHDKTTTVLQSDIRSINPADLQQPDKPIFIVMGGPPCQGFSLSNTRTRNMDNPNNQLFHEFVRFVKELKPSWFVFENVYGITNIEHGETVKEIENCFRNLDLGYDNIASAVLWASDYGVPQHRNRFFMIGNRLGIKYEFPKKHNKQISVREAIEDLPSLENGQRLDTGEYRFTLKETSAYSQLMRKGSKHPTQNYVSRNNDLVIQRYSTIPQGGNWRNIPAELMQNYADKSRCHSGIYRRLKYDEPSVVISNYRKSMLIHPTQDRGLSVREAARIQSFPDNFLFEGPISHIQQQIGNAVPPLLAKAVITQILKLSKEHEHR